MEIALGTRLFCSCSFTSLLQLCYCSTTAPLLLCCCSVTTLYYCSMLLLSYCCGSDFLILCYCMQCYCLVSALVLRSVTSTLLHRYCSSISMLLLIYTALLRPLHVTSLLLLCCWSTTALLIICYCSKRCCTVAALLLLWVSFINEYIKYHNLKYHINYLNCGEGYEDMIDHCSYTLKS